MCMMLYLGADNSLPSIEWQEGAVFAVKEIGNELYQEVGKHMKRKYHYILCSYLGCGCGFEFDDTEDTIHAEANLLGRQSIEALFGYIHQHVSGQTCELVSFWAGNEWEEIKEYTQLDLKTFILGDCFTFLENQYVTVWL